MKLISYQAINCLSNCTHNFVHENKQIYNLHLNQINNKVLLHIFLEILLHTCVLFTQMKGFQFFLALQFSVIYTRLFLITTSIQSFLHACIHVCIHVCLHVCIHACIHVCIHVCLHVCIHVYIHVCLHVCLHVFLHVYIHVCMFRSAISRLGICGAV